MKMTEEELKWFLALCKKAKERQKTSGDYVNYTIHITNVVSCAYGDSKTIKKHYAIAYSLKSKNFINIDHKNIVSFDKRGIDYINYLKSKNQSN